MSYKDVMFRILSSTQGVSPHITGHYGEIREKGPHGGSDFNYQGGQSGVNLQHPEIHAPISGSVTFVGGRFGTAKIRDAEGISHEILHTQAQSVSVGQRVEAGQVIARMGGRGPGGAHTYAQHVHYQMKDAHGRLIDPEAFWNSRTFDQSSSVRVVVDAGVSRHPSTNGEVDKEAGQAAPNIKQLQADFRKLGYVGLQEGVLEIDGIVGPNTRHAVESFQRAHGLHVDGIVGKHTLAALENSRRWPLLSEATHPHHALYAQVIQGIHGATQLHGKNGLDNTAVALTVAADAAGMRRVDHVLLGSDGVNLFAVQGRLDDPAHRRVHIELAHAMTHAIDQRAMSMAPAHLHALAAQQQEAQQRGPVMAGP
jgi:putative chitinase